MALTQVSTGGIKDGQVQTADLADGQVTVGKLHADALDRTYTLGASGTNHYTFTGEGLTGAVNDPTLYLTRGKTYRFVNGNSSGAHPFRIQTTVNGSAGTEYNTGVTNNGGAGGSTIVFEVPHDAPDVLYYQCTSHGSMGGILYVTGALADGTVTTAKIANSAVNVNKIADANVTAAKLDSNSVTTAKIADQAVTLAKLPHGTSSNDGKFLRANNGADPSFETVSIPAGTTINSNANNRVITGTDTANTLDAEGNLTFTGDILQVSSTTQGLGARFTNTGNEYTNLQFSANRTSARNALGIINAKWNNNDEVAAIYLQAGDDTTNKDDGAITFFTKASGGNLSSSMVINPNGNITKPRTAAMSFYNAVDIANLTTSNNNDAIEFSSTYLNNGGMSASNSNSRITVPTAGTYLVTGMVAGSGNGSAVTDGMQLIAFKNGSISIGADTAWPLSATAVTSGAEWTLAFSVLINASANDYFELCMTNIDTNNAVSLDRGYFNVALFY